MNEGYVILQNRSERTVRYKTPQGKEVCLTREVYLRDDISCKSELCAQHSQPGGCLLSKDIITFLVVDGSYALNFWEVFEFREIRGLVVTLSTANFVQQQSASRRPYRRIRASLDDPAQSCIMFDNEFHRQCYYSPQANESLTDYVTRMNWFAAHFYQNHLGNEVSVILVTDNPEVVSRCATKTPQVENSKGVTVMSLPELLLVHCCDLPAAKLLFESLQASLETQKTDRAVPKQLSGLADGSSDKDLISMTPNTELGDVYPAHLPESALLAGLRSGQFLRGILRISKYRSSTEATVVLTDASQVKHQPELKDALSSRSEISVLGMQARNRATEGDVVVVRLMPRDQWKGVSGNISATENCATETMTHATGTASTEQQQQSNSLMPCGFIAGVLNRSWRDYVCTYVTDTRAAEGVKVGDAGWLLVTPWDRRIPRIRLHTTQVSKLARERFIVRIDSWPAHSTYPNGHFVKSLGPIGDLETETQTILIEHGLEVTAFTNAQIKELAPYSARRPWLPDPAEIARRRDLRSPTVSGNPSSEDVLVFSIDPQGCEDVDDALSVQWLPPVINEEDGKEHRRVQLGVHIADVTFFVPPEGYINAEARRRSTSIYLADRRYDMLPGLLSGDICSLWSGVDRYAVSVIWEIDMELMDVIDIWYGRTVIRSAYKMTYEAAQQVHDCDVDISASQGGQRLLERLGGVDAVTGLVPELKGFTKDRLVSSLGQLKSAVDLLSLVACNIRTRRVARGGLELDSIEISVRFSDPKNRGEQPDDLVPKESLEMHSTIAELMIFANHWVARRCLEIYPDRSCLRRHPPPKPQHFDELQRCAATRGLPLDVSSNRSLGLTLAAADDPKDPEVKKVLLQLTTRAMTNALYFSTGADNLSREQFSHYGLALNLYTHFTSPIRRYADILVHRVLLTALGDCRSDNWSPKAGTTGDLYLLTSDELSSACQHMNEQHWSAQQVQRSSMELFQALYFRNKSETDNVRLADGIICQLRGDNGFGILVSRYGIRGSVCVKDPQGQVAWAAEDGQITWMPVDSGFEVTRVHSTDRDDCGRLEVRDTAGDRLQTYHVFDHVRVKVHVAESAAHGLTLRLQLIARRPTRSTEDESIPPVHQQQVTSQIVEAVHSDEAKKQLKRKADDSQKITCDDGTEVSEGEVMDKDTLIAELHDRNSVYHRFAKILRQCQTDH